ncbi:MAG: hypothetical protein RLZZ383_929 [Pseudomonadota bacterium]|jgi:hypothetical protein
MTIRSLSCPTGRLAMGVVLCLALEGLHAAPALAKPTEENPVPPLDPAAAIEKYKAMSAIDRLLYGGTPAWRADTLPGYVDIERMKELDGLYAAYQQTPDPSIAHAIAQLGYVIAPDVLKKDIALAESLKQGDAGFFTVLDDVTMEMTPLAELTLRGHIRCYTSVLRALPHHGELESNLVIRNRVLGQPPHPPEHSRWEANTDPNDYGLAIPTVCPSAVGIPVSVNVARDSKKSDAIYSATRRVLNAAVTQEGPNAGTFSAEVDAASVSGLISTIPSNERENLSAWRFMVLLEPSPWMRDASADKEVESLRSQLNDASTRRTTNGTIVSGRINPARQCLTPVPETYLGNRWDPRVDEYSIEWLGWKEKTATPINNMCPLSPLVVTCGQGIVKPYGYPRATGRYDDPDVRSVFEWRSALDIYTRTSAFEGLMIYDSTAWGSDKSVRPATGPFVNVFHKNLFAATYRALHDSLPDATRTSIERARTVLAQEKPKRSEAKAATALKAGAQGRAVEARESTLKALFDAWYGWSSYGAPEYRLNPGSSIPPRAFECTLPGDAVRADPGRPITLKEPVVDAFVPDVPAGAMWYLGHGSRRVPDIKLDSPFTVAEYLE